MRINSIKIQNYRQYRLLNIEFNKKMNYDIHIIIGQNGMGKTNLLNAISWCLYDEEPHLSDKNKALPIMNIEALSDQAIGSIGKVTVTINASNEDSIYEFSREILCKKIGDNEVVQMPSTPIVTVTKNYIEGAKIYQNDEAKQRMENLFPQKNSEYYFFDGERLNKYFNDNSGEKIHSSIFELSQVGLLKIIQDRLDVIVKEMASKSSRGNKDLESIKSKLEMAESNIKQLEEEITHYNKEASVAKQIINECNEFLIGMPDIEELEKRRKDLKEKENYSIHLCDAAQKKYLEFIREYLMLLNFYDSLHYSLSIISEKEANGMLPPSIDINLLKDSIKKNACLVCGSELNKVSIAKINEILDKLQLSTNVSHILIGMRDTLSNLISNSQRYEEIRDESIKEKVRARIELDNVVNGIKEIDNELLKYNNKEEVRKKSYERSTNESLLNSNLIEIGKSKAQLEERITDLNSLEKEFLKAEKQDESIKQIRRERLFALHAKDCVMKIQNEIMDEIRENLRSSTEEIFLNLIWKKNTFNRVDIDPNYEVALMHVDGYNNIGGCSAAEKAFLALSFTLALHKVACIDAPLVIDTPLSRVSDINRVNFAETLRELSKEKQMILLFTPSEYSEEVCTVFDPICSTKRNIETENERVSSMKEC